MVGHHRYSDADIDGRDIRRANIGLDWHNSATLWGGMRGSLSFGIDVDSYLVDQDSTSISRDTVISPNATSHPKAMTHPSAKPRSKPKPA